jgi:dTDP-4-dehydrorhamnose 3,5-epimerase
MTTAEQNIESLVFTEGEIDDVIIQPLSQFCDKRGWLVELYRNDELPEGNAPVMAYVSETQPGVARGPHEHVEQSDYFAFIGPGTFKLYLWDTRKDSATFGCKFTALYGSENRAAVIIPPGVVHAYKNVTEESGWVFNGPNALYAGEGKSQPVDEIRHEDIENSPYILD